MKKWILPITASLALAACGPGEENREATAPHGPVDGAERGEQATPRIGAWGVDASQVSTTIAPGDDFFTFVNAGWLERAEIPPGFSRFGAFAELSLEAEERVAEIIADATEADAEPGDPLQQIGAMHAAYMDTDRIDALGLEPIRAELDLVGYLRQAFDERLTSLEWMDDETRAEALAKLEAFTPKIGYPDRWHDYSSVDIRADELLDNMRRLQEWQWQDSLAKLDEPARDWEWFMSPQMVNAYYSSTQNEIVFPAGILQPPFFDPHADPAVNFGGIGAVIGHEMGHGFDDQGSKSDADGVLRNWWSEASREKFEALTAQLVEQYNAFEPIEEMNINGELTLGENIGDLGGLAIAYHAWHMYLDEHHGGKAPVLDGYTGDQRFFMSWAQVWRNLQTEESRRSRLINDPHSPPKYRVNGIVRNMDAWYEAFDVTEDDELWLPPERRLSIW